MRERRRGRRYSLAGRGTGGHRNALKQTGDVSTILSIFQKLWNLTVKRLSCTAFELFTDKNVIKTMPSHTAFTWIGGSWRGYANNHEFSPLPSGCA